MGFNFTSVFGHWTIHTIQIFRLMSDRLIEYDLFGGSPRAKGINSKKKGDRNETLLCKTFLKSWTGQKFIRVPSSGGRRLEKNSTFCGDVVVENEDFNFIFAVETKHLKSLGLPANRTTTILRKNSKVLKIWGQAQRDAVRAGKYPLLALRENGWAKGRYLIFLDVQIDVDVPISYKGYIPADSIKGIEEVILYGYESSEILSNIPYSEIAKYYE